MKLANDILKDETKPVLDKRLFKSSDTNRISFTLKNYERPYGVATQIFNVKLIGYEKFKDSNLLVATNKSMNIDRNELSIMKSSDSVIRNMQNATSLKSVTTF